MATIWHVGTRADGSWTHVQGIGGLVHWQGAGIARLFSASGHNGGLQIRDPAAGLARLGETGYGPASGQAGQVKLGLLGLGGQEVLAATGLGPAAVLWAIRPDGSLGPRMSLPLGTETVLALESTEFGAGRDLILSSAIGRAGISVHLRDAAGRTTLLQQVVPGPAGAGYDVQDIAILGRGAGAVVLALSAGGDSLSALTIGASGRLTLAARLGPEDGLAIDAPVAIEVVRLAGRDYALLGAAGSGSVAVIEVSATGRLRLCDQVNDDLTTRFAGLSVLETAQLGDRVFVVAGGSDDGFTLMTLLPGGRLLHLGTVADSTAAALENPAALSLSAEGGRLALHVAATAEAGISRFLIDPGPLAPMRLAGDRGATLTGDAAGDLLAGGRGSDRLFGGAGDDILIDGAGSDILWGGTGADVFVFQADGQTDWIQDFTPGEDRIDLSGLGRLHSKAALEFLPLAGGIEIRAGGERLLLRSSDGRDIRPADLTDADLFDLWHVPQNLPEADSQRILGTAGDDILMGRAGRDTIIGGPGRDSLWGGGGADLLLGEAEDPRFDPAAAQIFRLYRATLDRLPDRGGHMHWTERLLSGARDLDDIAGGFVRSREFTMRYGATTDADFVRLLYANVLDREPDARGLADWVRALSSGALSRVEVVLGFSESPEFRAKTAAGALDFSRAGYAADWADDVFRLYRATLDRVPDAGGFAAWTSALAQGRTYLSVVDGFTLSAEFRARYGNTTDERFVTLLYDNVLDRDPDPGGLATWLGALGRGWTRAQVVEAFAQSPEFLSRTAADLRAWMRREGPDDRLDGGPGANMLQGGIGADVFVFAPGQGAGHRVVDLERWDWIDLSAFGYASPAEALGRFSRAGSDLIFADAGTSVTFLEADFHSLGPDSFLL